MRFSPAGGSPQPGGGFAHTDLRSVNDAFTGRRLDLNGRVYRCTNCQLFYEEGSFLVVRDRNGSQCVGCQSTSIVLLQLRQYDGRARDNTPDAVTLQTYQQYYRHIITFSGYVHEVRRSGRGTDFALMFERTSWTRGLKMVVFESDVHRLGGEDVLLDYQGRHLTIRGLLVQHKKYGPEIIVSHPSMVLRVQ